VLRATRSRRKGKLVPHRSMVQTSEIERPLRFPRRCCPFICSFLSPCRTSCATHSMVMGRNGIYSPCQCLPSVRDPQRPVYTLVSAMSLYLSFSFVKSFPHFISSTPPRLAPHSGLRPQGRCVTSKRPKDVLHFLCSFLFGSRELRNSSSCRRPYQRAQVFYFYI
jgi:hypothetical protein